jgi:hypothetical protein
MVRRRRRRRRRRLRRHHLRQARDQEHHRLLALAELMHLDRQGTEDTNHHPSGRQLEPQPHRTSSRSE